MITYLTLEGALSQQGIGFPAKPIPLLHKPNTQQKKKKT